MHVAPIGTQIQNGVPDDLPGTVEGDISPAAALEYFHTAHRQRILAGQHVRTIAAGLHAECNDGWMLKQQELIGYLSRFAPLDELSL